MRILISAGEASGDMYGTYLLREIEHMAKTRPDFEAVGGRGLRNAGAKMIADSSRWGAMGIVASAMVAPRVVGSILKLKRALSSGSPGLFIPIDFGFVNVRAARQAHQRGWKVLYFMPPGSWRRTMQGESLPAITDEVVTPFSWSEEILRGVGANVHWYGHPLKQIVYQDDSPYTGPESFQIAVLPGSRMHEVRAHIPLLARFADKLGSAWTLEFVVARSIGRARLEEMWKSRYRGSARVLFSEIDPITILKRSRAAVVCSGTATLQAALCHCPMVVIYKFNKIMELEARLLRIRPKFISMPNIILNRKVVPELIQYEATPKKLALEVLQLLDDSSERAAQLREFDYIDDELGGEDAITRTARLALGMMGG